VHVDAAAIAALRGYCRGQRGGVVGHHDVARPRDRWQVGEQVVLDSCSVLAGHQQPHAVARQAARLWRLVRFQTGRQVKVK